MDSRALQGRAALITGASSGIGRAVAEHLATKGMDLWLVGRSEDALNEVTNHVVRSGGKAVPCAMDVRREGELSRLIASIDHPHLFAIINAAGVMHPEPILESEYQRWKAMLDTNVLATLEASFAGIKHMRSRQIEGHVINFSSLMARWDAGGVYGASKAAVEMIGRTLHKELANDDIRLTTIIPGAFATQLRRGLRDEEVNKIVAGIASSDVPIERIRSDPDHIARMIEMLLLQPIDLSISELMVRPPADLQL